MVVHGHRLHGTARTPLRAPLVRDEPHRPGRVRADRARPPEVAARGAARRPRRDGARGPRRRLRGVLRRVGRPRPDVPRGPAARAALVPRPRDPRAAPARHRLARLRRPARALRLDDHLAGRTVHDAVAERTRVRARRPVAGRLPRADHHAARAPERRLVPRHRRDARGRRRRHERDRALLLRLRHPGPRRLARHPHRRLHRLGRHLPLDVLLPRRAPRPLRPRRQPRRRRPARRLRPDQPPERSAHHVTSPLLSVRDLTVSFRGGAEEAVRGVSFDLRRGEVLGLVGESGSGKSLTALAVLGLPPGGARVSGSVRLDGTELVGAPSRELDRVRGRRIAMVFQDPLSAFTPVYRIGEQLAEAVRVHTPVPKAVAAERAVELLDLVGIPEPRRRAEAFPHEFSGGMRQRAMIAMAVAHDPEVLLADEPTTALDVTVQAQVLEVLRTAREATGAALLLVSHDLGVIAGTADRVAVMYAGRLVESAPVDGLFARPAMPYTLGLLGAVPRPGAPLVPLPGTPPRPGARPGGCPFAPRARSPRTNAARTSRSWHLSRGRSRSGGRRACGRRRWWAVRRWSSSGRPRRRPRPRSPRTTRTPRRPPPERPPPGHPPPELPSP
ncbi:peptide ABC transporter, ATP-binding protein [Streptomyces sp. SPB074]|nr:peptide ABC transporter, ATP-binding protein [Streptomyces sp. SPB074]